MGLFGFGKRKSSGENLKSREILRKWLYEFGSTLYSGMQKKYTGERKNHLVFEKTGFDRIVITDQNQDSVGRIYATIGIKDDSHVLVGVNSYKEGGPSSGKMTSNNFKCKNTDQASLKVLEEEIVSYLNPLLIQANIIKA